MYLKILNENFFSNNWNRFCNLFYGPSYKEIYMAVDPEKCKNLDDQSCIDYAQKKVNELLGIDDTVSKPYSDATRVTKDNSKLFDVHGFFKEKSYNDGDIKVTDNGYTVPNVLKMKYWDPTDPELKYGRVAIFAAVLGLGIYGCYWLYNKMRDKSTPNQNDINEARNADQQKIIYGQ